MTTPNAPFRTITHEADFCVVGGGMAGLCAAVAAARRGAKTVLMHDRPVMGGNASSECRVHICGADCHGQFPNMRETGILEELRLANLARNPNKSFSIWDTILYEKAFFEPNLTVLLNCSCMDAGTDGTRIVSVTGWQLTTQTYHTVRARIFADCSGDGVLAPLTGAECRMGREARSEYGESIAPETADERTMGMTCLFQAREYETPQPFEPLSWAHRFEHPDELPYGADGIRWFKMGYWWIELGGEYHSIHDTEMLRDELLKITYGVWDHIKNRGDYGADNWALDWIQFLPAKRESRRYIGDHVLTEVDIKAEGRFDDLVAYGGWSMDDHHPSGFYATKVGAPATIFHPAPNPYGIPYRAVYSKNIENLMFAGRTASCTHAAMSSTRVMGTCCSMGQAVGTAAAMAAQRGVLPRGMNNAITELQQALLKDDCYLPWVRQEFSSLTINAKLSASQGNPEPVRDGVNRPVGDNPHCWECSSGDTIEYRFGGNRRVERITLIGDSALDKLITMSHHQKDDQLTRVPDVVHKAFLVEGLINGAWRKLAEVTDNHQRLMRAQVDTTAAGVRWRLNETWGIKRTRLYAFYLE